MRHALKSLTGNRADANVVDGKLILSLPHAVTPVVWQMDLAQAAAMLEVQESTSGTFALTFKTPGGQSSDIAVFKNRTQAVDALMAVSHTLKSAHGQIRPAGSGNFTATESRAGTWIAVILGVLLFVILFNLWTASPVGVPANLAGGAPGQSLEQSSASENGVPLSADAFLNSR